MKSSNNTAGFTLIEVALIVTILGLIIAPFFNFLAQNYRKDQTIKTEQRTERIAAALASFVAENNRYPCPADWKLGPDDAGFGLEEVTGTNCRTGAANIALSNGIYFGTLPVHTLRLPTSDSINNDGWKYLYAVTRDNIKNIGAEGNIVVKVDVNGDGTPGGALDNVDVDGDGTNDDTAEIDKVPFIVIDPGKDGKGSASLKGTANYLTGGFSTALAQLMMLRIVIKIKTSLICRVVYFQIPTTQLITMIRPCIR